MTVSDMIDYKTQRPAKVRWFVVTQWNVNCDYEALLKYKSGQIRFICYGAEVCPKSGREHHQLFLYMRGNTTYGKKQLGKLGSMFGPIHCNVEPMWGRVDENEYYCSKESDLIKHGDEPKQGRRGDIDECAKSIMAGEFTVDQLCVENPGFFHQYGRTMDRIERIALRKRWRSWMTLGEWITGPSGSGKSHRAFRGYDPETHYSVCVQDLAGGQWWDGYCGQEIVIINEFRGQIPFSELLDLVDKYPKTVRNRGREPVPFLARKVIITSICTPQECYPNVDWYTRGYQFDRRFAVETLASRCDQKCSEGNNGTSEHFKRRRIS